jgi:signal transduction histidine kinase
MSQPSATATRFGGFAWPVAAFAIVSMVASVALGQFGQEDLLVAVVTILGVTALGVVGALIASRTGNAIGWVFLGIVSCLAITILALSYGSLAVPREWPLGMLALSFQGPFFVSLGLFGWVFLLFPTGQLPSRRWRWMARAYAGALAVAAVGFTVLPGDITIGDTVVGTNPLAIDAIAGLTSVILEVAAIALVVCSFASFAALIVRYRSAAQEERQQIRWLAFVGALAAIAFLLVVILGIVAEKHLDNTALQVASILAVLFLGLVMGVGIPAATLVAVFKYRLYDLNVVVRKTVVFAIVAVVFAIIALLVAVIPFIFFLGQGLSWWKRALFVVGVGLGTLLGPIARRARRVADRVVYGGRATPYEVLTAFSGRIGDAYAQDDVLPRMARVLAEGVGAERATVWLKIGGDLRPVASWPDATPDQVDEDHVDVSYQGQDLGALSVSMPANDPMNPTKAKLMDDLAAQAGLVLRNVGLIEELRASRQRLVVAQDEERRKIERNIHDGAQQQLVALSVRLKLARTMLDRDPAKTGEILDGLQTTAGDALQDLRDLARGIYPPLLADKGLVAALESQTRKAAVPVSVVTDGVERYPREAEAAVYFCVLEALNNVAKYADASQASVTLARADGALTFTVDDDGTGFDTRATGYGTGLQGMADRLETIGGTLEVKSRPGAGTSVVGTLPVGGAA